jgi:hypothetical protein
MLSQPQAISPVTPVLGEMGIYQQPEVPVMVFGMDWWDN